jgi:hypothetical protein
LITTKRIRITIDCVFKGDYIDADSVPDYLTSWIDSGLTDRDDLRGYTVICGPVTEERIYD